MGDIGIRISCSGIVLFLIYLTKSKCADIAINPPALIYFSSSINAVQFVCSANLTTDEINTPHWFSWKRNGIVVVDNGTVLMLDDIYENRTSRYNIVGDSSVSSQSISQTMTILKHNVRKSDHGQYSCILNFNPPSMKSFTAEAFLLIDGFLPEPQCRYDYENTNNQRIRLSCTSLPAYPPVTLQWFGLNSLLQTNNRTEIQLNYQYKYEFIDEELNFTCQSQNLMNTKECHLAVTIDFENDKSSTSLPTTLLTNLRTEVNNEAKPDIVYIIVFVTGFSVLLIFIVILVFYCGFLWVKSKTDDPVDTAVNASMSENGGRKEDPLQHHYDQVEPELERTGPKVEMSNTVGNAPNNVYASENGGRKQELLQHHYDQVVKSENSNTVGEDTGEEDKLEEQFLNHNYLQVHRDYLELGMIKGEKLGDGSSDCNGEINCSNVLPENTDLINKNDTTNESEKEEDPISVDNPVYESLETE
ncbi:uncharacterized protein [Antedon mediterranea]|uniref:uncharacterized protein n=1 Tax=Antedon mediterranea TaxID=105859 RepID=UPI003AF75B9A